MTLLQYILSRLFAVPPTPARCRCGRPADIYDHERPWKVWCGRCYLRYIGKGG
jgi:hypothetical protein